MIIVVPIRQWSSPQGGRKVADNSNPDQTLTHKQRACIAALTNGKMYSEAAMAAGVSPRTIARWRELPHFEAALKAAGRRSITDATRQLTSGLGTAIAFLLDVIQNTKAPYSVRTRAALGLIDRQIRLVEMSDILERLEALEAKL